MAHSHRPMSADGFAPGYYSDNTLGCFNVVMGAAPLVRESLDAVLQKYHLNKDSNNSNTIVLGDFGTADGGTSMPLIHHLCAHIHSLFPSPSPPPIQVYYEDQPINAWRDLFMRLHHILKGPPSYLLDFENVFVSAIGRSFYDQCLPPQTAHLMFSFTAMHWLSSPPPPLETKIHHSLVPKNDPKDAQNLENYKIQAQKDWAKIVEQRCKELVIGGRMIFANFCIDEKGQCLGNTERVKVKMWEKFDELWNKMRDQGLITEKEHKKCSFANYYRTLEEFKAPFSPPSSSSSSDLHVSGLKLVSIESREVVCPYHEKWMNEKQNNNPTEEDKKKHAKWYIPTLRTWSNSVFYDALDESRTEEERKDLINQYFQMYEDEVAIDPSIHAMDYVHAYVVVERVK